MLLKTIAGRAAWTVTTSACFCPSEPRYRVDLLVPLSATHHGVVGPETSPQALTRSGSVVGCATPGWSETSGIDRERRRLRRAQSGETTASARPEHEQPEAGPSGVW